MHQLMLLAALAASSVADTGNPTNFHYSSHLGATTASVDAWAKPKGAYSFRVGGKLVVRDGTRVLLSTDPWPLTGIDGGVADGTAISLDELQLAALSDAKYPEVILTTSGCGANCNGATTILTYDGGSSTYKLPSNAAGFYGQGGDVVTIGAKQFLKATLASPSFDCHACGEGTTPLLVRVRNGKLTDAMSEFPDRLRSDAAQAWSDYERALAKSDSDEPPPEDALFRYYADEVRLGNRAAAIARLRGASALHGKVDAFVSESDVRLRAGGISQ